MKVKLVFISEKILCAFSTKDPHQIKPLSKVVYKFVCASCNGSYVSHTCQHLTIRIDDNFGKDKKSHIYQYLISSTECLDKCYKDCFSVLDTANTKHQLRIKESLHITWMKPILNNIVNFFLGSFLFCSFSHLIWSYRLINLTTLFNCFYIW